MKLKLRLVIQIDLWVLLIVILGIVASACQQNSTRIKQKCDVVKINSEYDSLKLFSNLMMTNKLTLVKITESDPVVVNNSFSSRLDTFIKLACDETIESDLFEKFSLIYWYAVKYSQLNCCVPGETEFVNTNVFNQNPLNINNAREATLLTLFMKNGITKSSISMNGFTQSGIYFPKSREKFHFDPELMTFLTEVDLLQKERYQKYSNE